MRTPGLNELTVLTVAKAPIAGRVKTRLCPPLSPVQAADVAAAALLDTLGAAGGCRTRSMVALHGDLAAAQRPRAVRRALALHTVIPQRGLGLAARLVAAHADAGAEGPVLQIGMDTPQVSTAMLTTAALWLLRPDTDAVLGPASDGGWWALGLRSAADAQVLHDIPMSTGATGSDTLAALRALGLRVRTLPTLTDVDTYPDALAVARLAPESAFAQAVGQL